MENPRRNNKLVTATPFYVKDYIREQENCTEVPPKAGNNIIQIGGQQEEFVIDLQDGRPYILDGNNITFKEGNKTKKGTIISNADFEAKRKNMEKMEKQKSSKGMEIA